MIVSLATLVCGVAFLAPPVVRARHQESEAGDLASRRAATEELFAPFRDAAGPGYAFGVVLDGRTVLAGGCGLADLRSRRSIDSKTTFRLASVSKQFTAACVELLVEDGELRLEDTLGSVLTEFESLTPAPTLSDLVHHTSGIRDYLDLHLLRGEGESESFRPADSLRLLARQRALAFAPGTGFSYSNSNYLLLGEVVRVVSGQSLARFSEAHLFAPLGMEHTRFVDDHRRTPETAARGYARDESGWASDETELDHVGDGGVYSSIEDLGLWAAAFDTPGALGGPGFFGSLLSTECLSDGRPNTYAFGLDVERLGSGGRLVSHGGAFAGFRTAMVRREDLHLTVFVLANFAGARPEGMAEQVLAVWGGASGDAVPVPDSTPRVRRPPAVPVEWTELAGRWRSEELDVDWNLEVKARKLRVSTDGVVLVWFRRVAGEAGLRARRFPGVWLLPVTSADGEAQRFVLFGPGLGSIPFRRLPNTR